MSISLTNLSLGYLNFDRPDLLAVLCASGDKEYNQADFGLLAMDLDGVITFYNDAESAASGLDAEHVVGRNFFTEFAIWANNPKIGGRYEHESVDETIDYVLNYRMHLCGVRLRLLKSTEHGRQFLLIERASDDRLALGKASLMDTMREEVNSLRQAEEGSDAKSGFVARLSHDIRTPMNGVMGMLQLLLGSELSAIQRRYATVALSSGQSLVKYVNENLDSCRIDAAGDKAGTDPVPGTSGPRILLADDNRTSREVIVAQLESFGYQATAVVNGAQAVDAVGRGCFDLVLMECEMPVMDGFEATQRIRKSVHSTIPVIAVTADAMPEDRDRCLRAGMDDYITKPLEMKALADMIAQWVAVSAERAKAFT